MRLASQYRRIFRPEIALPMVRRFANFQCTMTSEAQRHLGEGVYLAIILESQLQVGRQSLTIMREVVPCALARVEYLST